MSEKILIIRSASFQQLDNNIKQIKSKFPKHELWMLTHDHGKEAAKKYSEISKVLVYHYAEPFDARRKVPGLEKKRFDAVIIPVTNTTGAGFSNVFLFGLTFNASKIYMCNMVSEIKQVSKNKIILENAGSKVLSMFSYFAAAVLLCAALPLFLLNGIIGYFNLSENK